VSDFAGLQIRTNATNAPGVAAYGGTPVTLAVSEVYEAMRTGVINGYLGLTESLLSFKLQEVTKYATLNPNFQCAFMLLMNKDVFNSMSPGQKAAIDRVSKKVWEETACSFLERDWADRALQTLRDANVEIITLPDEELNLMTTRTANLLIDYAKGLDQQGLRGTEGLEMLKRLVEKYNSIYPTN
jgi:TRAP-type C4-dicarboxylate transport system substrate-binding protein